MNLWDILLLAALAGIVFLAVRAAVKRAKSPGCCSGCAGRCPGCGDAGKQSHADEPPEN